jgi:Flp pilus assembly protein TadG
MIEFALCFLLFMAVVFGFSQLAMAVWMKSTLHFAVREGIRFAITGRVLSGSGHDASIKEVIRRRAGGILTTQQATNLITIQYYNPLGVATSSNAGGNTIVLTVNNFPVPMLTGQALSWVGKPITVSAKAVGRQEPYPNPPTR